MTIPMSELEEGQSGCVCDLQVRGMTRQRFLDLGLVPGTTIERIMESPIGDPICFRVRGAMIAIRGCDAQQILVAV